MRKSKLFLFVPAALFAMLVGLNSCDTKNKENNSSNSSANSLANIDMRGISFADQTFTYTGDTFSLAVTGELPEGVSVEYTNNGKVDAGVYEVVAKFSCDLTKYNPIEDMKAKLCIAKAKVLVPSLDTYEYSYSDEEYTPTLSAYDSTVMDISGTLSAKEVGSYTINVALKDKANYEWANDFDGSLNWSIKDNPDFRVIEYYENKVLVETTKGTNNNSFTLKDSYVNDKNLTVVRWLINDTLYNPGETIKLNSDDPIVKVYATLATVNDDFTFDVKNGYASINGLSSDKENVVIPAYVKYNNRFYLVNGISAFAFENNTILKSITLKNNVTKIGANAFAGCKALESLTFTDCMEAIGSSAFDGCSSLNNITFSGEINDWNDINFSIGWENNSSISLIHCDDGDIDISNLLRTAWYGLYLSSNNSLNIKLSETGILFNNNPLSIVSIEGNTIKTSGTTLEIRENGKAIYVPNFNIVCVRYGETYDESEALGEEPYTIPSSWIGYYSDGTNIPVVEITEDSLYISDGKCRILSVDTTKNAIRYYDDFFGILYLYVNPGVSVQIDDNVFTIITEVVNYLFPQSWIGKYTDYNGDIMVEITNDYLKVYGVEYTDVIVDRDNKTITYVNSSNESKTISIMLDGTIKLDEFIYTNISR